MVEYKDIFDLTRAALLIIATDAPSYTILDVNNAYLSVTNSSREELINKSVFAAFPANPTDEVSKNIERTIFSFEEAVRTKATHTMSNYRYDIPVRGTDEFEERYWTTSNTPVLDEDGKVKFLIHSPSNVTELFKLGEREKAGIVALREQRQQLYATFMQTPVGIAIFRGPELMVDLINPSLCEMVGKPMKEIISKPLFEIFSYAKGQGIKKVMEGVRITGIPYKGQIMVPILRKRKIEDVYLNFVCEPFREIDRSISAIIAVVTEVTDQVMAKQKLEEAEERGRLAVDAVEMGTYDLDLSTGEMITSKRFANIFGFAEPVPRKEYVRVFHPDDYARRERAHEEAVISGRLFYEARIIWKDNSIHWGRVEGKVYYDADRKATRILGTLLDITEQKLAKEEQQKLIKLLQDNEQLFRSITTAAPTALWMSDENGAITYVNQTWIDWTGRPFEEHMGDGWTIFIVEEDRKRAGDKFLTDLNNRNFYEVEFRLKHADGTVRWCVANGKPQNNEDGTFRGYIGSCVDITEQKNLQQQKDDFIGIASHELKTPVTSIKAYTQVLELMLSKVGETKESTLIKRMDKQVNRLTSLIGDLLDVTKINSGRLQFNDTEFDFNSYLHEIIDDLQRTSAKHRLIEDFEPTGIVFADKDRIGQVVANLITNAIKYSPRSDKIIIHTSCQGGELHLCVQDFGIGIPENNLNKVFEQFYRVSGDVQHTFPGLGLGLYISSEIIQREGGRIWVKSKEGQGSIFCFALPLRKAVATGENVQRAPKELINAK